MCIRFTRHIINILRHKNHLYLTAIPKGSHKQMFQSELPNLKHFFLPSISAEGNPTIERLKGEETTNADVSQEKMEWSPEIIIENITAGIAWNLSLLGAPQVWK